MSLPTPDWLSRHGGELRAEPDMWSWVVFIRKEPQYTLKALPAAGKHSCQVMQTINARRLDTGGTFPSVEEALRGGLEDLRKALGW